MNHTENQELLTLMEKCGRFLYHRRGGRRGQGKILRILIKEGEMTQKELQERLGIQSGSMSELVMKLEGSGFICKMRDETDRRKVKLKITDEGEAFFKNELKVGIEEEKKLFDALSREDQDELKMLLSRLFESWESHFGKSLFEHRKGCSKDK